MIFFYKKVKVKVKFLIFVFPCIIIYGFTGTSLMQIVLCYLITLFALHVSDVIHIHPQERHIMYMQMIQVSARVS